MIYVISIITFIVSWYVSNKLKSKFKEYSRIALGSNQSGQEVAENMLRDHQLQHIKVICVEGQLTDHYNPHTLTVNLSKDVYYGRNAASAAVAAHECGHAVQHATGYAMLELRSSLVPIQNASAMVMNFIMIALMFGGILIAGPQGGLIALIVIVVCNLIFTTFALITLPVEFDASKRALTWMEQKKITTSTEHVMAEDALKWAALTYVVAAVGSLAQLLYYANLLFNRSRED
jgi:Zn-dependent membrane protease YugP